ncbi:MAG: caspase family protein [Comamonas sp.]
MPPSAPTALAPSAAPVAPVVPPAALLDRRQWLYGCAASALLPSWATAAAPAATASATGAALPWRVLLIGNARYQHNAALANPSRDTALLAQAFQARGAQVKTLSDLSAQALEAAVRQFLQTPSARGSVLWLGYSGHAVQIGGRNYLQGVDSDFSTPQRVREHGVDLDLLLGLIERAQPLAAVAAIDACRNNPFEPERTRGLSVGLAAQEPRGLCVSFSTAPYTKALDGVEGQHSPYAQALAAALGGTQRKSLDSVLRETADSVYRSTRQRQIPEYRSALRGEWWFGPQGISLQTTTASTAGSNTATAGGASRSSSYRPDEPSATSNFASTDGAAWARQEQQLNLALRRLSPAQAQALVRRATPRGNETDCLLAAQVLEDGLLATPKAPAKARQLLLPLAQQAHALAQTLLGESFYLAAQYDQAYKWLSLAARTGYARAETDLGQMVAAGLAEGDPKAGALQMLRGMLRQSQGMLPPAGSSTPSPAMLEQAEALRRMLQPGRP